MPPLIPAEIAKQIVEAFDKPFHEMRERRQQEFANKLAYLMKELNESGQHLSREDLIYKAVTEAAMLTMKEMRKAL